MEEYKYLIPEESRDAIVSDVGEFRKIESNLRTMFYKNQYKEVLIPSFEYVDLYTKLDSGFEPEKMFQYINHEGKSVALRCDFTIPLARLYATKHPGGLARYCYFGKVYRKETMHKGRNSEHFQAGMELIGKPGLAGDKECMQMIQIALRALCKHSMLIEIGSAKFFHRLCSLVQGKQEQLTDILRLRDISAMRCFVKENNFEESLNTLLLQLPTCFGDIQLLQQVMEQLTDSQLIAALEEIKQVYSSLDAKEEIIFDLAMVPSMKYYTGLMIKGYGNGAARPIISGGRYDDLLPHFGKQVGAIGFCCQLDSIFDMLSKEAKSYD